MGRPNHLLVTLLSSLHSFTHRPHQRGHEADATTLPHLFVASPPSPPHHVESDLLPCLPPLTSHPPTPLLTSTANFLSHFLEGEREREGERDADEDGDLLLLPALSGEGEGERERELEGDPSLARLGLREGDEEGDGLLLLPPRRGEGEREGEGERDANLRPPRRGGGDRLGENLLPLLNLPPPGPLLRSSLLTGLRDVRRLGLLLKLLLLSNLLPLPGEGLLLSRPRPRAGDSNLRLR
mmetsp:Transcript_26373/g.67251  ORF Transcript_26373/g.67251 Transcript_26373/m.67251 type:complete len:239 (+) Transcript_26373:2282-2998(+)